MTMLSVIEVDVGPAAVRAGVQAGVDEPVAVVDGVLRLGGRRVDVPAIEATILNRLGLTPERVVRRSELERLIWHDGSRARNALDSRIHTLRNRVRPLGVTIVTIRDRGFVLSTSPSGPTPSTPHHPTEHD